MDFFNVCSKSDGLILSLIIFIYFFSELHVCFVIIIWAKVWYIV